MDQEEHGDLVDLYLEGVKRRGVWHDSFGELQLEIEGVGGYPSTKPHVVMGVKPVIVWHYVFAYPERGLVVARNRHWNWRWFNLPAEIQDCILYITEEGMCDGHDAARQWAATDAARSELASEFRRLFPLNHFPPA